jgi:lipopolysaccharide/colanic/teichoic acid biosynthesis glycosyltransferase
MEQSHTPSTDLSRTPREISAIFVPKAREPWLKRPLDVALSSLMLVLSAPVSLLIALAIKLEDGGPVFYRQERWGRGGTRFKAYKFRTMVPHSDRAFGIKQATENDERITRVGRVLRAMGLDELPQMISIFLGEMSLVGPRALAVGEILHDDGGRRVDYEEISDFWKRLSVRPGLTGVTTIYKPKDISPRKKFRYDLLYIRKQSFWLDVRLILLSFWISFRGKWEHREKKW